MALTELQKAQNKAAQLVRNHAHAARLQQYRREMDAVDAEPEVVQARKKFGLFAKRGWKRVICQSSPPDSAISTKVGMWGPYSTCRVVPVVGIAVFPAASRRTPEPTFLAYLA